MGDRLFMLPDVGEGLTEAEIVSWKVKPGDTVRDGDVLVEIETVKSLVELPSPYAGSVAELLAAEGETVAVGAPIVRIGAGAVAVEDSGASPGSADAGGERTSVLVGYGPRSSSLRRRPRRTTPPVGASLESRGDGQVPVLAKPPVRKLAKELGVDLQLVAPTGADGVITRGDVEAYADGSGQTSADGARETRVPIRGIRKHTADAMVASAFTAPHVTAWITVDATATCDLVQRLREHRDFRGLKVSPLLVVAKACVLALRRVPEANASWDGERQEIVLKHDVNLGIAAATPRGLVVPNIKNAGELPLVELCRALGELTARAREGRTPPAEMQGTTFTITNVGVFGIDAGTPILSPGTTAILALGTIAKRPWVVDDEVVPRQVTTLALSFDHRIVDGEQGSRFLADVAAIVQDPGTTLLYS